MSRKMKAKFEVDRYGGNQSIYLGVGVKKMSDSDSDGLVLDTNDYEDKINHIEISLERSRQRNEALTEEEQSILRSELR